MSGVVLGFTLYAGFTAGCSVVFVLACLLAKDAPE